jgi:hypothetical protein
MNSFPVLDSSAAAAPKPSAFPAAPSDENQGEAFGDVLAKASEEVDQTELDKKKDEPVMAAIPLVFFFPPPEIAPLPPPTTEKPAETRIEGVSPELAVCNPPLASDSSKDVIETVRPKDQKILTEAKDAQLAKLKSEKPEAEKISLKGFESIVPEEAQQLESEINKPPEPPPEAIEALSHGTLVAKQEKAMKNGQKSAEIAPAIEQKMPVGERSRRVLPDQAHFEVSAFVADTFSRAKGGYSIDAPAQEPSVRTIEAAQLVETIRTEVTHLRQRGNTTMTVALRPDSATELRLEISVARDGSIQANVRCERGDFQTLSAQWPQLQQSLAAQGIRVTDLSNPGNAQNHHHDGSSQSQNFDRGNDSQQRQQQPAGSFEEELAASTPRYATKTIFKTATAATRRWQSWA